MKLKKEKKNINNKLFNYYFRYSSPSNMMNKLGNAEDEQNKEQVYFINKQLTKIKNILKNVPKDKVFKIEENEKIINIVKRILELNSKNRLMQRLKY